MIKPLNSLSLVTSHLTNSTASGPYISWNDFSVASPSVALTSAKQTYKSHRADYYIVGIIVVFHAKMPDPHFQMGLVSVNPMKQTYLIVILAFTRFQIYLWGYDFRY